jgi:hypothetical protein
MEAGKTESRKPEKQLEKIKSSNINYNKKKNSYTDNQYKIKLKIAILSPSIFLEKSISNWNIKMNMLHFLGTYLYMPRFCNNNVNGKNG